MAADPIPWTFAAGGDVAEYLEWLTDVSTPVTLASQHRRLRDVPRVRLSFEGLESGLVRRWMENLLHRNGGGRWQVPLHCDGYELASAVGVGAVALPGEANGLRFVAGGNALLVRDDARRFEVVTVDAVTAGGITLAGGTVLTHPAGTRVLPLYVGSLVQMPQLSRFTGDAAPYQLEVRLDDVLDFPADAGGASYRGYPVLELAADWSADPRWTAARELATADDGTGPVFRYDTLGQALPELSRSYTAVGRQEIGQLLGLLYALAGRWQPIWVPSQAQDLRIVAAALSSATALDVEWCGLVQMGLPPNRRDLRIQMDSGAVIYRRVTGVAQVSGAVERLALDTALGVAIDPARVVSASWLVLSSQAADVNKLRWWKNDVVQTDLTFTAVPHGV
ncbi:MAG: hypothetical protein ACOH1V_02280 [Stenotrophomonas sp.]